MEYLYLHAPIKNVYGHTDHCAYYKMGSPGYTETPGKIVLRGDLMLFKSIEDMLAGARQTDNFKFEYIVTDDFIDSQPFPYSSQRIVFAMLSKIVESVPDEDGNETNLLSGLIGEVGFQSAEITVYS